ncbi:solute carrier family 22 member 23 isoform X1 [Pteropus vampyrus]|uniref:Solute carrier family 22 member 23 isoform X1 n=1 Tax=Pteropus vampyrus TaxID=132908 RepID=A0A6P6CSN9_PTEVA|nr:solute carrier family 22 member 23 isoform X1 [Pteropus vampyrus]
MASAQASSKTWSARVGRRPVLLCSIIFILIFGLTVALSVNVTMFSTLRFFEGFCLAGVILTLYALRIELCPPGKRFMITMVASFVAIAGQFLMPGLAALCRDWQVLQALIICPFLLMLLYWSVFPESLRWLMATQQFESAKKLILHFTQKNCMNPQSDIKGVMPELEKELSRRPKKVCIVKVVGTRNLWKNIVVLCVNSLTGYGIHHCFARSMMGHEVKVPPLENFYADYYTMASIALASCLAMCVVVRFLGRRGGLLFFMILTALASLLQLGLLNLIGKYSQHPDSGMSDSVKDKFSITFSIVGMFASHAVGSLSVFFCAEITPTVIRLQELGDCRRIGKDAVSATPSPLWLGQKRQGSWLIQKQLVAFLWQIIMTIQCPAISCRWEPLRPSLSSCPLTKGLGKRRQALVTTTSPLHFPTAPHRFPQHSGPWLLTPYSLSVSVRILSLLVLSPAPLPLRLSRPSLLETFLGTCLLETFLLNNSSLFPP